MKERDNECNQSWPETNPQHFAIDDVVDLSVTNLGLRPIRNEDKVEKAEDVSVTNLGLRPIRNWRCCSPLQNEV